MKILKTYKQIFEQRKISSNADIIECVADNDIERLIVLLDTDDSIIKNINYDDDVVNPLFIVMRDKKLEFVKVLVEHGYEVGPQGPNNYSALIYSSICGMPIFKYIVEHSKKYINVADNYGYSPLMSIYEDLKQVSVYIGPEYMELLFENGADPFMKFEPKNYNLFDLMGRDDGAIKIFFEYFPQYEKRYNKYKKVKDFNL